MNLNVSFKNLDSSPALVSKIEKKAEHLKKYFQGKMNIRWICSIEGGLQRSEVNIHAGQSNFHAHAEDKCIYNSLDLVLNKLEKQLQKKSMKMNNKLHRKAKLDNAESPSLEDELIES